MHTKKEFSLKYTLEKCYYFLFNNKHSALYLVLIMLLTGIIPSVDSIFLQKITDAIESFTDSDLQNIDLPQIMLKWVFIYVLWWESINFLFRLYDYVYLKIMPSIKAKVMDELYDYVQFHSHEFFQNNLAGDISSRITEASRSLEMVFAYFNEKIIRKLSVLTCALATLYMVNANIALIFFIWFSFFCSLSIYFAPKINEYSTIYSKDKAYVAGKIVDSISNISAIRMFASHKFEHKYLQDKINKTIDSDQQLQWFMLKLRYVLGLSCSMMIGGMIYYIIHLRSNMQISIGQCVLIITLCLAVIDDVWDMTQEFGDLFEQIGVFNQSMSLLEKYKINDVAAPKKLEIEYASIEFKNVNFTYRNNSNSFINQSVYIKPNETVGLVGFSGSGKTTFANMITRLYDIDSGKIFIDGQDIGLVSQESLRENISVIPQEPILFHRSVRENIRYGKKNATDKEVEIAAKAAHIHDSIMNMPQGYNTICGERGNNFSGGQRQRIIIARAFLKQAPILILDEATSALDSVTESSIQESLNELMKDKTVLIIAHRLSTLVNVDRLLIFENGSIAADGSHEDMKNNNTLYKKLWKSFTS